MDGARHVSGTAPPAASAGAIAKRLTARATRGGRGEEGPAHRRSAVPPRPLGGGPTHLGRQPPASPVRDLASRRAYVRRGGNPPRERHAHHPTAPSTCIGTYPMNDILCITSPQSARNNGITAPCTAQKALSQSGATRRWKAPRSHPHHHSTAVANHWQILAIIRIMHLANIAANPSSYRHHRSENSKELTPSCIRLQSTLL